MPSKFAKLLAVSFLLQLFNQFFFCSCLIRTSCGHHHQRHAVHPCSCRNPPPHCRPAESGRSHGKATDSARSSRLLHECKKAKRSRMRIHTCRGNARRLATPDFCPRTRSALLACSSFASRSSSSPPAANSHPPRFLAAFSGVCGAVDAAARSEAAAACREDGCGLRLILMDGGGGRVREERERGRQWRWRFGEGAN